MPECWRRILDFLYIESINRAFAQHDEGIMIFGQGASVRNIIKFCGRKVPVIANPLWRIIYPHIRRDEIYVGDEYHEDRQSTFKYIFDNKLWGDEESRSGDGSSMAQTRAIRERLPKILHQFKISTLLDAPCGDFNWMRHTALPKEMMYIGADIVPQLIDQLNEVYGDEKRQFKVLDIVEGELIQCDMWMCRDVLFHLSESDIKKVLDRVQDSGAKFFLTTTYPWIRKNRDIVTGGFRYLNLQAKPFNLPKPILTVSDWTFPEPPRVLALWRAEDIALASGR